MKNFFKPEDFLMFEHYDRSAIADAANYKLNALIESAPVVYFHQDKSGKFWLADPIVGPKNGTRPDTHKARLILIEEIVKEPCVHRGIETTIGDVDAWVCRICGVELQATWKTVDTSLTD